MNKKNHTIQYKNSFSTSYTQGYYFDCFINLYKKNRMQLWNEQHFTIEPLKKPTLQNFPIQFSELLQKYCTWRFSQWYNYNEITKKILQAIEVQIHAKAKRARPMLTYFAYKMCARNTILEPEVLRFCIAEELFHTFALIHDDITDEASMRRGKPTVEYSIREEYKEKPEKQRNHAGLNAALYAGDIALVVSNQIVQQLQLPKIIHTNLEQSWYEMQIEVVAGQNDDGIGIVNEPLSDLTIERIEAMLSYKSGRYSIQKPLVFGAILANASQAKKSFFVKYGEVLGRAFQLKDDLLGTFGTENTTGKSNNADIRSAKRTLLLVQTYHALNSDDKQKLVSVISNPNKSESDIEWVRQSMRSTGVKQLLEKKCEEYSQQFIFHIEDIQNTHKESKEILIDIARYIVNRES